MNVTVTVQVTVQVTIDRGAGNASTVIETFTDTDAAALYTERQNARSAGERALGRVLDRIGPN